MADICFRVLGALLVVETCSPCVATGPQQQDGGWPPEGCVTVSADQPSSIQYLCDLEQLTGLLQPQSPALWNRLTRFLFDPKNSVKLTACYTLGSLSGVFSSKRQRHCWVST